MRNYFVFGGRPSTDFNTYIAESNMFDAAERDVEQVKIPGRSGTLTIDRGRFENFKCSLHAYIPDEMSTNLDGLRNWLLSKSGYCRYEENSRPGEYRMARYTGPFTVSQSDRNGATFDLIFDCKPQRFLTSGEEVTTFDASDLPSESFSGNPATFETDGEYKISELLVGITPVQSGSGDPSPTNVRPISGRTGLTVTRAGKNLLPKYVISPSVYNNVTFTVNDDGSVSAVGTASATCNAGNVISGIGGEYILSGCPSGGGASTYQLWVFDQTTGAAVGTADTGNGATVTLDKTHTYNVRIRVQSGYTINKVFYPMLRPATITDDTYEPYTAQTYPVTWSTEAGTIYGGTLDVVSGVLTVEYGKYTIPSDIALTDRIDSQNRVYWNFTDMMPGAYLTDENTVCNRLPKSGPTNEPTAPCICIGAASNASYVYLQGVKLLDGVTNLATLRTWLEANPVEFTYKLATPLDPIQLSPTEVKTLLGGNTIYTDAGGVDGKYLLPLRITNPTRFEAKPIIRIYGAGTVGIGDVNVTFDGSSEYVDLDCELQDAYYGPANKNSSVTLDPNRFPVIPASGAGIVLGSGITQVDITPRWFEL